MASGPLSGVRMLEFTQAIAGPLGGMLLTDMGADSIKVEPLEGEAWRVNAPFMPHEAKSYQTMNRGKRSLAIDLRRPEAQEAIHRIVKEHRIDVVVSNYGPDVAERLRFDYATLCELRPELIYVDSTAFGRRGPWAERGGYDNIIQAASGMMASGGRFDDQGAPMPPGGATADHATAYSIAWGTCAALFYRERTGKGQLVETSMLANAMMFQLSSIMSLPPADEQARTPFLEYLREARERGAPYAEMVERRGQMRQGGSAGTIYYRSYLTEDGAIVVAALSPALRQKVRTALAIEHDPRDDDPNYDAAAPESLAFRQELAARVDQTIRAKPSAHWVAWCLKHGVPVSELLFPEELDAQEQVIANDYIVPLEHDLSGPQVEERT